MKKIFLFALPGIIFVPLFLLSHLLHYDSGSSDWFFLIFSSCFAVANPLVLGPNHFTSMAKRALIFVALFATWCVVLGVCSFWLMGFLFSDWL
jgi:hypothetical protein